MAQSTPKIVAGHRRGTQIYVEKLGFITNRNLTPEQEKILTAAGHKVVVDKFAAVESQPEPRTDIVYADSEPAKEPAAAR